MSLEWPTDAVPIFRLRLHPYGKVFQVLKI